VIQTGTKREAGYGHVGKWMEYNLGSLRQVGRNRKKCVKGDIFWLFISFFCQIIIQVDHYFPACYLKERKLSKEKHFLWSCAILKKNPLNTIKKQIIHYQPIIT